MSSRTPNQIISDALKLLGNETLTAEAEVWLNNVLDRLYEDFRWPFQEKSATGAIAAGATSIALPDDFVDFWDRNGLRLVDSNNNISRIIPTQADSFDLIVQDNTIGPPEFARIDLSLMIWQPYPTPDVNYSYRLRYKKRPDRITDFDADVIVFPNDAILTQAVFIRGLQFEDDDRYPQELQILENMIKKYRRGYNVSPTKGTTVKFQSQTFKGIDSFR
jgi:hypothetical protein